MVDLILDKNDICKKLTLDEIDTPKPDNTVNPSHYTAGGLETHDKIELVFDILDERGHIDGIQYGDLFNILKYFDRMGLKEGVSVTKDATKCANYIEKLLFDKWFESE